MGAAPTDPWAVLAIASTATAEEIRTAWKAAALRTHPDKMLDDGSQFRAVQAAYEVLRDAPAWHSSKTVRGTTSLRREEQARALAEEKAVRKRHFEERFRQFLAEQETKKHVYELKKIETSGASPADAMKFRQDRRVAKRYQKLKESKEQQQQQQQQQTVTERQKQAALAVQESQNTPAAVHDTASGSTPVGTRDAADEAPYTPRSRSVAMTYAFLTHPSSTGPLEARVDFVRSKGVEEEQIATALRLMRQTMTSERRAGATTALGAAEGIGPSADGAAQRAADEANSRNVPMCGPGGAVHQADDAAPARDEPLIGVAWGRLAWPFFGFFDGAEEEGRKSAGQKTPTEGASRDPSEAWGLLEA